MLLTDDHNLFRAGIRCLLEKIEGLEVVGEAGTGREALRKIHAQPPDVVLMDIMMPELNGLDATARIVAKYPNVRVIILSTNGAEEYVLQAIRAGAAGYLLKTVSPIELELAIKAVGRGETYLSSAVATHVVEAYATRGSAQKGSLERLSPRQREVLQLIAEGNTNKEMARKLNLSVKTVEKHRTQLMATVDIHDVPGLVRYAIRVGLITPEL
ncbi:MAG TPA: response regulator transcription factor [Planctomycetaceae bacterium]